jgi:hypothetical protein
MEETKNDNLTALQKAKQRYYQKIKHNPEVIEKNIIKCKKYYEKNKDNVEFKQKVSIQKKQYYLKKKELKKQQLLQNMVEKSLDF